MATNKSIQYINYFLLKTIIINNIKINIFTYYNNIKLKYIIK